MMYAKKAQDDSEIILKATLTDPFLTIRHPGLPNKLTNPGIITTRNNPQILWCAMTLSHA